MELYGKVALITGGGSGIGKATAKLFAEEGAKVTIADIDQEKGAQFTTDMKSQGHDVKFIRGNVSDPKDAEAIVSESIRTYGKLDILFNNAGVITLGTVVDARVEDLSHVIDVNLKGTLFVSKYAIPALVKQRGVILNAASGAGLLGVPNAACYSASKGGVVLLTKSMAAEYAPYVRVNCLCPGYIETPMYLKTIDRGEKGAFDPAEGIPLARIGQPKEVAAAALFLVSARSSYITGASLTVDGGLTCTGSVKQT